MLGYVIASLKTPLSSDVICQFDYEHYCRCPDLTLPVGAGKFYKMIFISGSIPLFYAYPLIEFKGSSCQHLSHIADQSIVGVKDIANQQSVAIKNIADQRIVLLGIKDIADQPEA